MLLYDLMLHKSKSDPFSQFCDCIAVGLFPLYIDKYPLNVILAPKTLTLVMVIDILYTKLLHVSTLISGAGNLYEKVH